MTSFVFPGQGSQIVGMSKDFYDNFQISREAFEEIEDYVSLNLKKIIFEDSGNLLNITKYTQISIFASSILIFKAYLSETGLELKSINSMLGHSLGEYTALACSDKLSLKDCSIILKKRGDLMNDAISPNKTGMVALIGLGSSEIQNIIDQNKINIEIANDNSPIQVVISGDLKDLENSREIFLKNNVKKYVLLNVSSAFHSRFMINAQKTLNEYLEVLNFNQNKINIISNYSANISNDSNTIKENLKNQMANKVRWTESIKKLENIGESKIIEIGPGKVLSGLIKRISDNFDIKTINKVSDLA